jgi:hypothetical protein
MEGGQVLTIFSLLQLGNEGSVISTAEKNLDSS